MKLVDLELEEYLPVPWSNICFLETTSTLYKLFLWPKGSSWSSVLYIPQSFRISTFPISKNLSNYCTCVCDLYLHFKMSATVELALVWVTIHTIWCHSDKARAFPSTRNEWLMSPLNITSVNVLTKTPDSLSSIQCFGALMRFICFFGPRA